MKKQWMQRCLQLAQKGLGRVSPNPLVGCVIVHQNHIIGEGFHQKIGEAHAEVNAINSVKDTSKLKESTLYVNLEPCAHHGLTPPCANLIIEKGIPHVVIANHDPFEKVNGKGVEMLRAAGVTVETGIESEAGKWLNRRFFTFYEQQRPYVILKYAKSEDGFIDSSRAPGEAGVRWISAPASQRLTHLWRSEEDAILIGTRTALIDDPSLTTRAISGKNPMRLLIDRSLSVPQSALIFSGETNTVVFNAHMSENTSFCQRVALNFEEPLAPQIMTWCFRNKIQSIIIEGGAYTLQHFIDQNLWDEARVLTGAVQLNSGLRAPHLSGSIFHQFESGTDRITFLRNLS